VIFPIVKKVGKKSESAYFFQLFLSCFINFKIQACCKYLVTTESFLQITCWFSGLAMELSISQFLHNLGLEHLLEIFDREQVIASVSMFIIVL